MPADFSLSRLLGHVSPADFFDRFWGTEFLHVRRDAAGFYGDILEIRMLDEFLLSEQIPAALVHAVKDGYDYPPAEWSREIDSGRERQRVAQPEKLLALYSAGATLILSGLHRALPSFGALCRVLSRDLEFPVQANVYITPPASRGFKRHHDEHEVIVLQIAGAKRWKLYPPAVAGPVSLELNPGDLLYVPRGMDHEGEAESAYSVHVTLGLYPVYEFQLLEELASAARKDPALQRPVQPGALPADLNARLITLFENNGAATLLKRRIASERAPALPPVLSDTLAADTITLETRVRLRPEVSPSVNQSPEGVTVSAGFASITVPGFLAATVARLISGEPVAIGAVPGLLSPEGKLDLVRSLLRIGLLEVAG